VDGFDTKDGTTLEYFNPETYKSGQLWKFPTRLRVQDMKINGTSLVMARKF